MTKGIGVMDVLLTRSLESAHIIDFNPFGGRTDGLLYAFDDFQDGTMQIRMIDSAGHSACCRNEPSFSGNMLPIEVFALSQGRGLDEFKEGWIESIKKATEEERSESDEEEG